MHEVGADLGPGVAPAAEDGRRVQRVDAGPAERELPPATSEVARRQFPFSRAGVDATLLPTLHPSAVLRGGGIRLAEVLLTFVRVKRLLES